METLKIVAEKKNLDVVQSFVEEILDNQHCTPRAMMQISLAVEEIFVNISSYAYAPTVGETTIFLEMEDVSSRLTIEFQDSGKPFNPLGVADADTTAPAEARGIGGLGILLVKKTMDSVAYRYENGKNILQLVKTIA